MAERVVKVTLSAQVAEYQKGMREAANATRNVGSEAEKLAQQKQNFEILGRTMLVAGGVMAAGVGLAINKFAEFDQAMSNVIATGDDAAANQDELREAALEAGAATVFSATESANAIEEMAKAGLNAQDILGGGLIGSLDLAAAGGLGVARAAEVMSTTLQQFQLEGEQSSHVADLLAAGAGKAMGEVEDMAQALNQAGLVANQFNIPVEETVGTLAAFASAGMLGSDAGTSMRTMLLRLANPTKEVQTLMKDLNIEAYDSQGQFIGLAGLAGELETSLAGMTDAQRDQTLAMIFGQDAIRGANILLREGKKGIQEWTAEVDDQGYAADVAAKRLDNLRGDLEALGGAVDTALIQMGAAADGPGRFLVQVLGSMVDGFAEMPAFAQQGVFWLGAAAAAAAVVGGAFLTAVPKVAEFNAAMDTMPKRVQNAGKVLGIAAKGVGALTAAFAAWTVVSAGVDAADEAMFKTTDTARNLVAENTSLAESYDRLVNSGAKWQTVAGNTNDVLDRLGDLDNFGTYVTALDETGQAAVGLADALQDLSPALSSIPFEQAQRQFSGYAAELGATDKQVLNMLENMPEFKNTLIATAQAQGLAATDANLLGLALGRIKPVTDDATEGAEENTAALAALEGQAGNTEEKIEGLADAIRGFASTTLNVRDAERGFEQALDDLTESVEDNGDSLDRASQAGRDNEAALDGIARAALDMAAATLEQTNSEDDAVAALQRGRDGLIEKLEAFGITGQAAEDYADKLGLIPENIPTYVDLNISDADARLRSWLSNPGRFALTIPVFTQNMGPVAGTGTVLKPSADGNIFEYANGGGVDTGIYAGRPGSIHKFAEPETIWEAYISGKPDQRDRNIGIWQETGRRLGVESGGSQAPQITVKQDITALPGTDERALANRAAQAVKFALRG